MSGEIEAAAERLSERGWDYANCPDQWGECNDARVLAKAYLARLAADRAEREEWQPIETAPTDGTPVIVWPPTWKGYTSVASYDDDRYAKKPRPYWRRVDAIGVAGSRENQPTHWRPCLDGPREAKGGAE